MKRIQDLRVGFITARSMFRAPDGWRTDSGVGRVIDELASRARSCAVAMSDAPNPIGLVDHLLRAKDIRPLPFLAGVAKGLPKLYPVGRVIRGIERECDVSLVQLPFASPLALLPPRVPRVYHVCADISQIVATSENYRGVRALPARALANSIDLLQATLSGRRNARLVTNGDALLDRYGRDRGCSIVSASLLNSEIGSVPRRRATGGPFRVLYVGYLRQGKGIDVLLEACLRLTYRTERPIELSIVGAREIDDRGMTDLVKQGLATLRQRATATFEGPKTFGEPLFSSFADADVLALPSVSEGTPRVLVEARAFGCPVVATRVGGIPSSVTDGVDGLLIPPSDAPALEEALLKLATDEPLRAKLAAGGMERAKRHTIETMVDRMVEQMEIAASA